MDLNGSLDRDAPVLPIHAPVYGPPPYDMTQATLVFVNFTVDERVVRSVVPAPLEAGTGDATAIVGEMVQLPHCGWFYEGSIRVPARFGDVESQCTPHLWCSADEAILVGREVYGMPKILCDESHLDRSGNQVRGEVRRRGDLVMKVGMNVERRADPTLFGRASSRLSVRSFLSPDPTRPHYREVLYVPLTDFRIEEAWEGRGFLEIHDTPHASPGILRPQTVGAGYFVRASWSLGAARSLWSNYEPADVSVERTRESAASSAGSRTLIR